MIFALIWEMIITLNRIKLPERVLQSVILRVALCAVISFHSLPLFAQNDELVDELPQLLAEHEDVAIFRNGIAVGVTHNPLIDQRRANFAEAQAARRDAQSAVFPTIDLSVSANRSIAREFSNDPDNVLERSRGAGRTDISVAINQILYDFGTTGRSIAAASARIEAAQADVDNAYDEITLRAIRAWIDVFTFARLAVLADNHLATQNGYRAMLSRRIQQGVSAPADHARLDAAIAVSRQRAALFRQELGNAEARYREIFGPEALLPSKRPPVFELTDADVENIIFASRDTPPVRSATAQSRAAQEEARASRSRTLPSVRIGLDAGRYGIFEPGRTDYDVRARVTLSYRLFGPGDAHADQAAARASAALSHSSAALLEAERTARIAVSDVKALAQSYEAYDAEYRASRLTRDAEAARFRIARGSMFDVLSAEERYFASAVNFLRSTSELDYGRYALLARGGILLPKLGIFADYVRQ